MNKALEYNNKKNNGQTHILIKNFWNVGLHGDKSVAKEDLGWSDYIKRDAQSDYPETIFRYIVEVEGLNILFYWFKDKNFYSIETGKSPVEVRRLYLNPNWDGKCEYLKTGMEGSPHTSSAGEILATFDEPTEIWDNLRIDNVPIGEVLENSVITDLD